jgi:hypothetical protein
VGGASVWWRIMNAVLVAPARGPWVGQAVLALMRVRLSTRVLMLAMSALLGATLYLVLNWPGRQAPVIVSVLSQPPVASAPAPALPPVAAVRPSNAAGAGSMIVTAARGVAAAADSPLSARASLPAPVGSPVVTAARVASPETTTVSDATVVSAPVLGTSSTGRASGSTASRLVPEVADSVAAPPTAIAGANHIVVPTAAAAASGPNRILVPTAKPAR